MERSVWPYSKVSVILLPSGEQGEQVLALAGEWTRMGLLGPALWVQPESVRRARTGPPRIGTVVLALDRDQHLTRIEVDLFEALAREPVRLVRLVKLRSAAPSREIDTVQDEIADHVGEYLTKSMPMAVPTSNVADQATDLARVALICAPTEFQLQQRVDWAASEYGTVVVASPEDRSSPWAGDAFVRDNDRFVGFTLMHLASVGGLWSGVGYGTFELFPREASGLQSVWVSRVFFNAIITEALGRRTAAQVLDDAGRADSLLIDPSTGSPPEGTAFIDDSDVPAYVDQMVEAVMALDHAALGFHGTADERPPERIRIGIGEQLSRFGSFSVDKLATVPKWSWRWLTSRTARSLTRRLQGEEGNHVVGQDYDSVLDARDAQLIVRRDDIFATETAVRAQLAAPVGAGAQRTTPRLWARLRELVFGALDGSADLSDLGFVPIEGKVPIFGRVSDVFPDPDDAWRTEDGPAGLPDPVDWHSLARSDPRVRLVEWAADARIAEVDAEAALAIALDEIAMLEHRRSVGQWQTIVEGPTRVAAPPAAAGPAIPAAPPASVDAPDGPPPSPGPADVPVMVIVGGAPSPQDEPPAPQTRAEARAMDGPRATEVADETTDAAAPAPAEFEGSAESATPPAPSAAAPPATPLAPAPAPAPAPAASPAPPPATRAPVFDAEFARLWPLAVARRDAAIVAREDARARQRERDAVIADYDAWSVSRDRSFAWRLLARLARDRAAASESADRFAAAVDELQIPPAGEIVVLRKAFHRRLLLGWAVIVGVAALLVGLPALIPTMRTGWARWYPADGQIVLVGIAALVVVTFIALAAYHRGWSRFERRVNLAHAHLAYVSDGSRHARGEVARLASLHRQTVDWLVLLSHAIHTPWRVRPEWRTRPDYDVAREAMPFAMGVGSVLEDDHAATTRLRRLTTERLVVRGWRHAAFLDLIREVGAELGQDAAAFGISALDEDLPHSSNHTRRMLRDTMEREAVLVRVAAPRLQLLMAEIQRTALHGSKPRVRPIGEDPLRAIGAMTGAIDAGDDVPWDEFLLGSLVGRREPVTPLSPTWLADRHVQEGYHEHVRSYLVLPQRLQADLDFAADAPVTTIPFGTNGRAPIDLVWRADVAGPLPVHAIGLWDATAIAPDEPARTDADSGV